MGGAWFYTARWRGDLSHPEWHDDKESVVVSVLTARRRLATIRETMPNRAAFSEGWIPGNPFYCVNCGRKLL